MTRDQVLRKIKACLAMAARAEGAEAETAMRQAKSLMARFGLTATDVRAADVKEVDSAKATDSHPPRHITALANFVADSMNAAMFLNRDGWRYRLRFVGVDSDAELAAFYFDLLRRQMERDIAEFRKRHCRRCKRSTAMARIHEFGIAWAVAAKRKLEVFESVPERQALSSDVLEQRYHLTLVKRRALAKRPANTGDAGALGWHRGQQAQLQRGVGGDRNTALEDGS